ncbi:MAG: ABC transporter ATP-binding protein [Clostridia bacterium]
MIECRNISVKTKNRALLDNVSFTANEGEITVILGKNGSGKTTVLRCITLNCSYEGDIYLEGENIKKFSGKHIGKKIASMVQNLPKPQVTVEKLVSFGRFPYTGVTGILSEEDKKITSECIKKVKIENIAERRVDKISGGERRKAFFAMMLCQGASVILLDEPTANLDSEYTKHLTNVLIERKNANDTVVMVLHDINHAIEIADKIIVMDKGRKVFEGTAKDFAESTIPKDIFSLEKYMCKSVDGQENIIYR